MGDANLDGRVDGFDFIAWNAYKFTATGKWSQGDWNADGNTDGQDILIWDANKFQSSDGSAAPLVLPSQAPSTTSQRTGSVDRVFARSNLAAWLGEPDETERDPQ